MGRRKKKKQSLTWRTTKAVFRGTGKAIAWTAKSSYKATKWSVNKIQEKNQQRREEKVKLNQEQTQAKLQEEAKLRQEQEQIKHTKQKESINKSRSKSEPQYYQFSELKSLKGDFYSFEEYLHTKQSTIGIILGARGTGKSAIGMKILENIREKTGRPICALGFNAEDLPIWIKTVDKIEDVSNGSFLLADEAGIEFSSRDSMSSANKLLSSLLLVARHKDLSVLFISQNSSNVEINAIRQADYLILKPSSLLQIDFERKKIKEIYLEVDKQFEELDGDKGLTYIYSDLFRGFVSNKLPSFWSTNVSKAYKQK